MKKLTKKFLSLILIGKMISVMPSFTLAEEIKISKVDFQRMTMGSRYKINVDLLNPKPSFRYTFNCVYECDGEEILFPISDWSEESACLLDVQQNGKYKIRINVTDIDENDPADAAEVTLEKDLLANNLLEAPNTSDSHKVRLTNPGAKCFMNSLMQQINGLPQLKKKLSEKSIVRNRKILIQGIEIAKGVLNSIDCPTEESKKRIENLVNELDLCRNSLISRNVLGQDEIDRLDQALKASKVDLDEKTARKIDETVMELFVGLAEYSKHLVENAENRKALSIYDLMQLMDSAEANQCVNVKDYYDSMGVAYKENGEDPIEIFERDILPLFSENDVDCVMKIGNDYVAIDPSKKSAEPSENSAVTVVTFPGLAGCEWDFRKEYKECLGNSTELSLGNNQTKTLNGFVVATNKEGGHYCSFAKDESGKWYYLDDDKKIVEFDSFDKVLEHCNANRWHFSMAFFAK